MNASKKTTTRDMTEGNIALLLIRFALPLIAGNFFQVMYNTVDSLVVGNFVGKEALAAVGSTTMIVNIFVFFFNGISTGATVVISRSFGAQDEKELHRAIETTMALTFVIGVIATVAGLFLVQPLLLLQSTPADVMASATTYLRIYFLGMLGLLIYNMGSGILRAVGDTRRPLYFLIFTSLLNVVLDLLFVIVFHMGVAGAGYATIISQFFSAFLVLALMTGTHDIYRFIWKDLRCDADLVKEIFRIGMPAGIQSILTAFSNVFVQSYINYFGSSCMAGWSCFNKLDSVIFLPMNSMAAAATTFVGQNVGAKKYERVNKGTIESVLLLCGFSFAAALLLYTFAEQAAGIFSSDAEVIHYGALFLRLDVFFILFNCVNHTLAGGLRGRGDSNNPMIIMLLSFVLLRQIYLFVMTRFVMNTVEVVGLSYPVGWITCCVIEVIYFYLRWVKKPGK